YYLKGIAALASPALKTAQSVRVTASSIEFRLLEMQRKLSQIAEIPKILSSTLATVSQTFDKLTATELEAAAYVRRKCSYDEDVIDYELSDVTQTDVEAAEDTDTGTDTGTDMNTDVDGNDDDNENELKQIKLLKDVTPESDYASEANYATNESLSEEPDTASSLAGDHDVDVEADDVDSDNAVYYMKLPAVPANHEAAYSSNDDEHVDFDDDEEGENDDCDFLSTTYTWNLRNVPKLRVSDADEYDVYDLTLRPTTPPQEEHQTQRSVDNSAINAGVHDTSKVRAATPLASDSHAPLETEVPTQKLLFKLDNLERKWPWADREKIIYKQSTCHLVPRQPLGLVGQRIQLLAKKKLFVEPKTQ
ncbi:uncharacterized protein LOC115619971, partial [Scaptodrosophila lebanonensis]|uniref:Uncharacterized protein LOC115619971 n=1 Tax=Drosophila lebanonensis TaxID=7225 RepID=A0A6J2T1T3_DROLE